MMPKKIGAAAGAAILLGLFVVVGANPPEHLVFAVGAAALVWLAHADNIARLSRGEERRFDFSSRREPGGPA